MGTYHLLVGHSTVSQSFLLYRNGLTKDNEMIFSSHGEFVETHSEVGCYGRTTGGCWSIRDPSYVEWEIMKCSQLFRPSSHCASLLASLWPPQYSSLLKGMHQHHFVACTCFLSTNEPIII